MKNRGLLVKKAKPRQPVVWLCPSYYLYGSSSGRTRNLSGASNRVLGPFEKTRSSKPCIQDPRKDHPPCVLWCLWPCQSGATYCGIQGGHGSRGDQPWQGAGCKLHLGQREGVQGCHPRNQGDGLPQSPDHQAKPLTPGAQRSSQMGLAGEGRAGLHGQGWPVGGLWGRFMEDYQGLALGVETVGRELGGSLRHPDWE